MLVHCLLVNHSIARYHSVVSYCLHDIKKRLRQAILWQTASYLLLFLFIFLLPLPMRVLLKEYFKRSFVVDKLF
jgi:hypothetical protein